MLEFKYPPTTLKVKELGGKCVHRQTSDEFKNYSICQDLATQTNMGADHEWMLHE